MFFKKVVGGARIKKDERDFFYEFIAEGEWEDKLAKLPTDFKLKFDKYWLSDQGRTSNCVFFGAKGLGEYYYKVKLSARYLAKFGRKISGLKWGAYTRDGPKALVKFGTSSFELCQSNKFNTTSDYNFQNFKVTRTMQQSASEHIGEGYVRADGVMGGNDFDKIRLFIYNTKSPCIVSIPYYPEYNSTKDQGEFIKNSFSKKYLGHILLCIGWKGNKYIFLDSVKCRLVYYDRMKPTWDAWGITSFKELGIKKPKKPIIRNLKLEQKNAIMLKEMIYSDFAKNDKARVTAFKHWFRLINAKTYNDYTFRDLINWIYNLDRKGTELFDIDKNRKDTLK